MTAWNYRMVSEEVEVPITQPWTEQRVSIIEAYYDEAGVLTAWCPAGEPQGGTVQELADNINRLREALGHPLIEATTLPGYDPTTGLESHR